MAGIIIAVMPGITPGSGKYSFISSLSGDTTILTASETSQVQNISSRNISGRPTTIVDMPGFSRSGQGGVSDTEKLKNIGFFLINEYNLGRKINCLVYVLSINWDDANLDEHRRNLDMFKLLCGRIAYRNVVVLTTSWDVVDRDDGERRETHLKVMFFDLVTESVPFMRYPWTPREEQTFIEHVLNRQPLYTRMQEELCGYRDPLKGTAVGSFRHNELGEMIAHNKQQLQTETDAASRNSRRAAIERLEKELEELKNASNSTREVPRHGPAPHNNSYGSRRNSDSTLNEAPEAKPKQLIQLDADDPEYSTIEQAFFENWYHYKNTDTPRIVRILKVEPNEQWRQQFNKYKETIAQQRKQSIMPFTRFLWHGVSWNDNCPLLNYELNPSPERCNLCHVVANTVEQSMLEPAIRLTQTSSKADVFTEKKGKRAIIRLEVVVGRTHLAKRFSNDLRSKVPVGYDSVLLTPAMLSLNERVNFDFGEYSVYQRAAVLPTSVVVYE